LGLTRSVQMRSLNLACRVQGTSSGVFRIHRLCSLPDGACHCERGGIAVPVYTFVLIRPDRLYRGAVTLQTARLFWPLIRAFVLQDANMCTILWRNSSLRVAQTNTDVTSFSVYRYCLPECDDVRSGGCSQTFRKNVVPQSWGSKSKDLYMQRFLPPFSGWYTKQVGFIAYVFRVE
jgi:hypothetical protein